MKSFKKITLVLLCIFQYFWMMKVFNCFFIKIFLLVVFSIKTTTQLKTKKTVKRNLILIWLSKFISQFHLGNRV